MARISLNSNISSLTTQRRLGDSTRELSSTFERLSSGLRINRAADDAAGLAIADNLKADNRVFAQGIRNLNDGLSLLDVADGALTELSNIVVRIRELAEQSANGTLSNKQREALDQEAQELSDEFTRIAQTTEYNGLKLFDGSLGELSLQAGFGVRGAVSSTLGGAIGDGTFMAVVSVPVDSNSFTVQSGDFNLDGFTDIASFGTRLSILEGQPDGTFSTSTSFFGPGAAASSTMSDFNGDGILDFAATSLSTDDIKVYLGTKDGSFNGPTTYSSVNASRGIAAADFDRDGDTDIISIGNLSGQSLGFHRNNGDGTFTLSASQFLLSGHRNGSVADFNRDGLPDLAVATDFGGGSVSVLLNTGDPSSWESFVFNTGLGSWAAQTADLNSDSYIDIITSNASSNTISVLLGVGDGGFKEAINYDVGDRPYSTAIADFNGDGVSDIASGENTGGTVSILLGEGDGSFGQAISYNTAPGTYWVTAGDFNHDGVSDLATVTSVDSSAYVLFGRTAPGAGPLLPFSLATKADALQAMAPLDRKIEQLALQKGTIGAFQSRVEVAINNLQIGSTNIKAAESRIRDVDVAFESARLTRLNILQQAGAAVLGQANIQPQTALLLLEP